MDRYSRVLLIISEGGSSAEERICWKRCRLCDSGEEDVEDDMDFWSLCLNIVGWVSIGSMACEMWWSLYWTLYICFLFVFVTKAHLQTSCVCSSCSNTLINRS